MPRNLVPYEYREEGEAHSLADLAGNQLQAAAADQYAGARLGSDDPDRGRIPEMLPDRAVLLAELVPDPCDRSEVDALLHSEFLWLLGLDRFVELGAPSRQRQDPDHSGGHSLQRLTRPYRHRARRQGRGFVPHAFLQRPAVRIPF